MLRNMNLSCNKELGKTWITLLDGVLHIVCNDLNDELIDHDC